MNHDTTTSTLVDSQAAVGMITGGSLGVAPALMISYDELETLEQAWEVLGLCRRWQLAALYGDQTTLTLHGQGSIPITGPLQWQGNLLMWCLAPIMDSSWTMDDPAAVRFFMAGCKRHGYVVLLPALNQHVVSFLRPILGFLRRFP